ncbi:hypothetical protein C0T31_05835 [Dysgonamonadaceae bacterium]|nr:hypothetical protein C0T31_05835 [Dysgonamonadaceae bacterium]
MKTAPVVSEYQRYKFRKQITTIADFQLTGQWLYQNIKDINFESKSQLLYCSLVKTPGCIRISKI